MTGRILLVNDSKFESMIISDLLRKMGYNVLVSDEISVMGQIQSFNPDYLIVNYVMRNMYGDQLISLVKLKYPYIKCILSSCESSNLEKADHHTVDAVFKTPVNRDVLEEIFKRLEYQDGLDMEVHSAVMIKAKRSAKENAVYKVEKFINHDAVGKSAGEAIEKKCVRRQIRRLVRVVGTL